ncbi:MAG: hypothetical protein RIQ53_2830 [Pseudomonadota bacterium]|jgi:hypothetical protein
MPIADPSSVLRLSGRNPPHAFVAPSPAAPAGPPQARAHGTATGPTDGRLRRVFMVGCPRSGTTVVQAALSAHAGLLTLPETHFFAHLLGGFDAWLDDDMDACRAGWRKRLGLYWRPALHRRIAEEMQGIGHPLGAGYRWRAGWTGRASVRRFVAGLDEGARRAGRHGWLEKSPDHIAQVEAIQALCPDARFIHVLRHGEDVVASAIEGEARHARERAFSGGIGHWVRRWNRAAAAHLDAAGRPGHLVVLLEDLIAQPEREIARLCAFLDLPAPVDAGRWESPGHVADLQRHPWQTGALAQGFQTPQRKFEALFGPQMQSWIRSHLADYPLLRETLAQRQQALIAALDGDTGAVAAAGGAACAGCPHAGTARAG